MQEKHKYSNNIASQCHCHLFVIKSLYLHTFPVEPAGIAGRTFEDGVTEDWLDGFQADRAGLRQAEFQTYTQRLSGTVIRTVGPGHKDTMLICNFTVNGKWTSLF